MKISSAVLLTLLVFSSCETAQPKKNDYPVALRQDPDQLVHVLFIARPQNKALYETAGVFDLNEVAPLTSGKLLEEIVRYLQVRKDFMSRYGDESDYYLSYSILIRMDPITFCPETLMSAAAHLQSSSETRRVYSAKYQMMGSSSPYENELKITLTKKDGDWTVSDIQHAMELTAPRRQYIGSTTDFLIYLETVLMEAKSNILATRGRHAYKGRFTTPGGG